MGEDERTRQKIGLTFLEQEGGEESPTAQSFPFQNWTMHCVNITRSVESRMNQSFCQPFRLSDHCRQTKRRLIQQHPITN